MKKLMYLIVLALILGLVLTGCSLLSNIGQAPANDQSELSCLTKGEFDVECPAAPAVAGLLLEAVGLDNRYGTGKDGGNYIADVAKEMGPETDFHEVEKCDTENYKLAIAMFLILQGAEEVAELFQADLESAVYEGTCNLFGSHAGDTMTFTFSNDIYQNGEMIMGAYFEGGNHYRIRSAAEVMDWEIEDNVLTVTANGTFDLPRDYIGAYVIYFEGLVDSLGNEVVVDLEGVEVEGIVTYPTTEYSGTFISTRDVPGVWSYDVTIARDCDEADIVSVEINLIDPYGEVIETNVEGVKEDYAYWVDNWNIKPNLAAVGTATYGSFEGNFMFLFADSYIQMLLSTESYNVAWNSNGVWATGVRDYDIWSNDGGFWQ